MSKYQVNITAISEQSPKLLKVLRLIANLEMKEAKIILNHLVDSLPCILVAGIDLGVAEHIVNLLQENDAIATFEASSLVTPMLLYPPVNQCYTWHIIKGISPIEQSK